MYPNLGPGMMIDLDGAPATGPDVLLSHEYVARAQAAAPWQNGGPGAQSYNYNASSLYAYVLSNPLKFTDPFGLDASDGKCPEKWTAKPTKGISLQYGCYCGLEPVPPRKKIPPAIDDMDKCCKAHDECYDAADKLKNAAATKAAKAICDKDLVACAGLAVCNCQNQLCLQTYNGIKTIFG